MAQIDLSGDPFSRFEGDVQVAEDLSVEGALSAVSLSLSSQPPIGYLSVLDATTTGESQATVSSAWTKIDQWSAASTWSGVVASTTSNDLSVATSGFFLLSASLSLASTVAGRYELECFVSGSSQDSIKSRVFVFLGLLSSNAPIGSSLTGILSLTSTDVVDLRVRSTGAGSVLLNNGNLNLVKVG